MLTDFDRTILSYHVGIKILKVAFGNKEHIKERKSEIQMKSLHIHIATDKRGYPHKFFLTSPQKHMLWVLNRSASSALSVAMYTAM